MIRRYEYDCSLGIVGVSGGRLLTASGTCQAGHGGDGLVRLAVPNDESELTVISVNKTTTDE